MKKNLLIYTIIALITASSAIGAGMEEGAKTFISPFIKAQFVLIPAGTFTRDDMNRLPVTLSKPFYMQTTEVTQEQWVKIMGNNPSLFRECGNSCPVENVSWVDVQEFIRRLNQQEQTNKYRLPTEAEWEYACRAGSATKYSAGDSDELLGDYAWYEKNSGRRTHPVAQKKPNAWGLYDTHGNVWEWCQDWQDDYPARAVTDPKGPLSGQHKVMRGGAWLDSAPLLQCAFRGQDYHVIRSNDIGFRLVRNF